MQIIIPMSGIGKRFIDAGYKDPKPLIEIDGKPIIEHVVNLFPGENDITFICNSTHLKETKMREILNRIAPSGKIVEIPNHKKGPVYAVSQIFDQIKDEEEVIVNYCDFAKYWDYQDFLRHTRNREADGAIPAYKGFHPHMLGTTNYAFMRDDEQWMLEIQEKKPFTDNRMQEYASDGTYYFKKGTYVKKYFQELMNKDLNLNGEYYVSMIYNLLIKDGLKVSIYDVQHMLQWGTPQDVEEYNGWSDYFRKMTEKLPTIKVQKKSVNLIPLAGRGSRFANEGYKAPKPLLEVSGKPMIVQASSYLPDAEKRVFICLEEHLKNYPLKEKLHNVYPDAEIVSINQVTEGQACTVELGLKNINLEAPLFIAASDNGMLWNQKEYEKLINDTSVDGIVFTFRHHPSAKANPQMYGWVKVDGGLTVKGVSVKKAISDNPYEDHAIVGAFYFKKARLFIEGLKKLYSENIRVNNEFYVDSIMDVLPQMGYQIKAFEVESYICWGTPNDLKTYEYWQSFFHKCSWHPYSLEKDVTMNKELIENYDKKYRSFQQEYQ